MGGEQLVQLEQLLAAFVFLPSRSHLALASPYFQWVVK